MKRKLKQLVVCFSASRRMSTDVGAWKQNGLTLNQRLILFSKGDLFGLLFSDQLFFFQLNKKNKFLI